MTSTFRSEAVAAGVVAVLVGAVGRASAHVKYVTPGSDPVAVVQFLGGVLTDPFAVAVLAGGGLTVVVAGALYLRAAPVPNDVRAFRAALAEYEDRLPWLVRLSVGLPLVGAGFSGYFFSPAVHPASEAFVRLFGITVGFLLLFGFATRLAAAAGLLAYLAGLAFDPTLVLAFEYVPGLLAVVVLGGGRPSADHVVARMAADDRTLYSRVDPFYRRVALPFVQRTRHLEAYVPTVLRLGIGVTFVYLGVSQKLMAPGAALAVVGKYHLTSVVPVSPELWVVGAGLTEALVGVLLVLGAFTRAASGVAFALFTTTLFGLPDDPVLAHLSLFGLVSALLVTGGGPYSVDAALHRESGVGDATSAPADPASGD